MDKNALWKWLILLALTAGSLALIYPPADRRDAEGRLTARGRIRLGLDLKGGMSFTVDVDRDELRKQVLQSAKEAKEDLSPEALERRVNEEARRARDVGIEAIRNRVDGLGIAEPAIFPQGDTRAVIQLPGVDQAKSDEARRSIESAAFLEFRLVHKESARWTSELFSKGLAPAGFRIAQTKDGPVYARDGSLADHQYDRDFWMRLRRFGGKTDADFMLERDRSETGADIYRPYFLETRVELTGKAVRRAWVDYDHLNQPKILLELTGPGRRLFAKVTRNYAPNGELNPGNERGRQLAIIMDGRLYSAPEIRSEIPHGRAEITGRFSQTEAQRLVNVLEAGSLPAPMKIIEERTVAPTLGSASVRSGVVAALVGGAAVLLFMLVYYRFAGLVANIALLLNMILLPLGAVIVSGFMGVVTRAAMGSGFELPTLTLPGIAGIVLTLGMAVDANVLIYERIREEQKTGKHFLPALDAGYDKAFTTILDSNLTTLIAAIIMFWQGSGPIRGYAVTLSAGIIVSMYTAIWVTKMLFHTLSSRFGLQSLKMLEWVKPTAFDFLKVRRVAYALSGALLLVSLGVFYLRGNDNLGVDFVGDSQFTLAYDGADGRIAEADLRAKLVAGGLRESQIKTVRHVEADGAAGAPAIEVRTDFAAGDAALRIVKESLADRSPRELSRDSVGPQIGRRLKRQGVTALVWALVAMVIYISWRFEFGFAVAAIVALLHDAVISVGLFCLFGRQLSLPMIAVVLTIVGYSVNDTIVIFDRIREMRKLYRDRKLSDLANLAINSTLSRTMLTSGTTLLSVLALLIFGGGAINDFALLLLIGVIVGTYSTIFIATPIAVAWRHKAPAVAPAPAPAKGGARK